MAEIKRIAINPAGNWRIYWGNAPLPEGASALGTVSRGVGDEGALLRMPTGSYVQGNAGALRSLPQGDVRGLLKPSARLVSFVLWGAAPKLGLSDGKVRVADGASAIDRVVASLERDSGLVCCGGPRSEGTALEKGRPVADHWAVTLGRPCPGGGFTPEGEVWISIAREG